MRIALIVEGDTERAFLRPLRRLLESRLAGKMPRLDPVPQHGRLPTRDKLKRLVENLLRDGSRAADAVIALTDVHTGTREFADASAAKRMMREWVGGDNRFHPHAAQFDFEAWLLPFWDRIQVISGSTSPRPAGRPETIDHDNPPARRITNAFRAGRRRRCYSKPRDAWKILEGQDLMVAVRQCVELKAFLNTILSLCDGEPIA